jgi:GT2 family glycosyltransferase
VAALGGHPGQTVEVLFEFILNGQPQLSIIIVNHRADAILGQCLRAIDESRSSLSPEIVIVDNPAGEPGPAVDLPKGLNVRRIAAPGRIGFAAACNLGAIKSSGEYVMFLNPDVTLERTAIGSLYAALQETDDAGIVVGRLVGDDGRFQASCRRLPTVGNLFLSRGSFLNRAFHIGERVYTLPDYDKMTAVEAAAAAMLMMSRSDYERLSGFDESFFIYMEDTDLCYRAGKLGVRIYYVPAAVGKHSWGYSTGQYRFRRIIWHHRAMWIYFAKHHRSLIALLCLGPALLVNCFLSLMLELFTFRK